LLTRHNCEVVVAPGAGCCGALPLHMGKESRARVLGRSLIRTWTEAERAGPFDAFVINASGCGTTIKEYDKLFPREAETQTLAASIARRALDVSELVQRIGLKQSVQAIPLSVAYHDACSLQHAQGVVEPPRQLLRKAGFRVVEVPERHFCCGSAGTYNMLQPDIAAELGRRKGMHVDSTGAAIVAAGNLGCVTQIGLYSRKPVVHTIELLDWATGGPLPPALSDVALPGSYEVEPLAPSQSTQESNAIW
jgi:glycolate oxidase iron-sulfur subunit